MKGRMDRGRRREGGKEGLEDEKTEVRGERKEVESWAHKHQRLW